MATSTATADITATWGAGTTLTGTDDIGITWTSTATRSASDDIVLTWGQPAATAYRWNGTGLDPVRIGRWNGSGIDWLTPPLTSSVPAGRIARTGTTLTLNGSPYRASGINWHWVGLRESTHPEAGGATGHYPTHAMLDTGLDGALALLGSGGVIRAHTLGISAGLPSQLVTAISSTGALTWNTAAFEPLDYFLNGCKTRGLFALGVLTDPYWYYHRGLLWWVQQAFINQGTSGIPSTYLDPETGATLGTGQTSIDPTVSVYANSLQKQKSEQFYRNTWIRTAFNAYVTGLLNHVNQYNGLAYKDDPTFAFLQAGNELALSGTQYPDHAGADGVSWQAQLFAAIKALAPAMLTVDGHGAENTDPAHSPGVADPNCDILDLQHLYQATLTTSLVTDNAAKAVTAGKVGMIGEIPMRRNTAAIYTAIEQTAAVALDFTWALYTSAEGHSGGTADGSSGNDDTTYFVGSDEAWRTIQSAHAAVMNNGTVPPPPAPPTNILRSATVANSEAAVSSYGSGAASGTPATLAIVAGGIAGNALQATIGGAAHQWVYVDAQTAAAPVTPGQTYTMSAHVKLASGTPATGAAGHITWRLTDGSYLSGATQTGYTTLSSGWTLVTYTATAPATAAWAVPQIELDGPATGTAGLLIDQWAIYAGTSGSPWSAPA